METLEKTAHHWAEIPAGDVGDAVIAAMAQSGIEHLFFTSGAEIVWYQEAIAKAAAQGRPTPKLITSAIGSVKRRLMWWSCERMAVV